MSTFDRMLDAARIHVCSVVNIDVENCLLVTIPPCRPGLLRKKNWQRVHAAFHTAQKWTRLSAAVFPLKCHEGKETKLRRNEPMQETMGVMLGQPDRLP